MRNIRLILPLLLFCSVLFSACGSDAVRPRAVMLQPTEAAPVSISTPEPAAAEDVEALQVVAEEITKMELMIGDLVVPVQWEDNESVEALRELVKDETLTISMSMYGGFEQVGSLGTSLPRDDVKTTTQAGDIVLYSGNQIVVFYGSNSWAYTRLGRIEGMTAAELKDLLGNGDVTLTITFAP